MSAGSIPVFQVPQQENEHDCGVFLLFFEEFVRRKVRVRIWNSSLDFAVRSPQF